MVARSDPANTFANLLDNTRTFVATHDGESERKVARCEVLVRVAHA
jgi:hypothetical protein